MQGIKKRKRKFKTVGVFTVISALCFTACAAAVGVLGLPKPDLQVDHPSPMESQPDCSPTPSPTPGAE